MPKPTPQEHRTFQEWLYLEPDGGLTRAEQAELERHLGNCGGCRTTRREVAAMGAWLDTARVEVDPSLAERVMENLPPAGWEARNPRAWRGAAAALAVVALAAVLVAILGGQTGTGPAAPTIGAARAMLDLLLTTAVAGAGLLTASWQGLGLALGKVFGGSKLTLAAFAVFVGGIDFLFVRYLLRQPRRALAASRRR